MAKETKPGAPAYGQVKGSNIRKSHPTGPSVHRGGGKVAAQSAPSAPQFGTSANPAGGSNLSGPGGPAPATTQHGKSPSPASPDSGRSSNPGPPGSSRGSGPPRGGTGSMPKHAMPKGGHRPGGSQNPREYAP